MEETQTITEAGILADVIAPDRGDLSPEVAHSLLRWKFTNRAAARMNQLAERNRKGTISESDREELQRYLRVGNFVNVVQAKARLSLSKPTTTD